MNRASGLILSVIALTAAVPALGHAQCIKQGNNMWTRSAGLYLDRARQNPRPDEQRALNQQALDAAVESTQKEPHSVRGWFLAGQAYIRLGDYVRADSMFDRVEQSCPDEKEVDTERLNAWITAYNKGVGAVQAENADDALAHMTNADIIYQKRAAARLNIASIHFRKGDQAKAAEAYRSALEILRGPARKGLDAKQEAEWAEQEEIASFNLAQLLASQGKNDEAIAAYKDYLARDPENVMAKTNLAVVLTRAGRRDEAGEIYTELLKRPDLGDKDYFTAGVGLFQAEQHERAGEAFRKSLEKNPYNRDALYNLAQTIYARLQKLEDERAKATADRAKALDAEMKPLAEELIGVAEKARELDPANRNVLALIARAQRVIADATPDPKAANAIKEKTVEILRLHQDMPFEVENVELKAEDKKATLTGKVQNLKLNTGDPIKLVVTLYGAAGSPVATQEVSVPAPAAEETTTFEVTIPTTEKVTGWKYEIGR